jgi:hypothetical protein
MGFLSRKVIRGAMAAGVLALGATQALAAHDIYQGDGAHNPNFMPIPSYHAPNFCPSGLSPVLVGGVISCGTPSAPAAARTYDGHHGHHGHHGHAHHHKHHHKHSH